MRANRSQQWFVAWSSVVAGLVVLLIAGSGAFDLTEASSGS